MEPERIVSPPVLVRRIGPKMMARDIVNAAEQTRMWKTVAGVAAIGVLLSFVASFWLRVPQAQRGIQAESSNLRQPPAVIVPAKSTPVQSIENPYFEIEKLKTKNRRLEALVQVLQQRVQAEKRNPGLKIKN